MIGLRIKVKVDTTPWKGLLRDFKQGRGRFWTQLRPLWALRYSAYLRRRYVRLSRGSGEWDDLANSTKRQRRGARRGSTGSRKFSVLVDTGILKQAVNVGAKGNLNKKLRDGIRFGIGGNTRHPEGKLTIGQLAVFHHEGNRRKGLPARPIIVAPDRKTNRALEQQMVRALKRAGF